jgi:hypothetical protein
MSGTAGAEGLSSRAPAVLRSWLLLKSLALPLVQLSAFARLGFLLSLKPHDDFCDGHAGTPHTFLLEKAYGWTSIRSLLASS